jgi:hypothetical protein
LFGAVIAFELWEVSCKLMDDCRDAWNSQRSWIASGMPSFPRTMPAWALSPGIGEFFPDPCEKSKKAARLTDPANRASVLALDRLVGPP